jgi:hypothetical protein
MTARSDWGRSCPSASCSYNSPSEREQHLALGLLLRPAADFICQLPTCCCLFFGWHGQSLARRAAEGQSTKTDLIIVFCQVLSTRPHSHQDRVVRDRSSAETLTLGTRLRSGCGLDEGVQLLADLRIDFLSGKEAGNGVGGLGSSPRVPRRRYKGLPAGRGTSRLPNPSGRFRRIASLQEAPRLEFRESSSQAGRRLRL